MNNKGGIEDVVTALIGLVLVLLTLYVVMVIWQPVTSMLLYPLLNNAEAFPQGGNAVLILNLLPLVAVIAIFLAFFATARGERRPPQQQVRFE